MLYLLHFDRKYKHAQHYLGYTENAETLKTRLDAHLEGRGARLIEVITEEGIGFQVAAILEGDRRRERQLKNIGHSKLLCPICTPKKTRKTSEKQSQAASASSQENPPAESVAQNPVAPDHK